MKGRALESLTIQQIIKYFFHYFSEVRQSGNRQPSQGACLGSGWPNLAARPQKEQAMKNKGKRNFMQFEEAGKQLDCFSMSSTELDNSQKQKPGDTHMQIQGVPENMSVLISLASILSLKKYRMQKSSQLLGSCF